jgi:hypothetical protein
METKNDFIIASIHFTFAAKDADKAESLLRELRDASVKEPRGDSIPGRAKQRKTERVCLVGSLSGQSCD